MIAIFLAEVKKLISWATLWVAVIFNIVINLLISYIQIRDRRIAGGSSRFHITEYTGGVHQLLFNITNPLMGIMGRLQLQGVLITVIATIYIFSYEQKNNTGYSVFVTKTGRSILLYKTIVSLAVSIILHFLIAIISLSAHFAVFDYRNVWNTNVSTTLNFIQCSFSLYGRPFTTWTYFSVAAYFLAHFGLGFGMIICSMLMIIILWVLFMDGYITFFVMLLINVTFYMLPEVLPLSVQARFLLMHTPVWLYINSGLWFTYGGIVLWRYFELLGMGVSLMILILLCVFSIKQFGKSDIS